VALVDALATGYHSGFARSIQNYSQILQLFGDAAQQVGRGAAGKGAPRKGAACAQAGAGEMGAACAQEGTGARPLPTKVSGERAAPQAPQEAPPSSGGSQLPAASGALQHHIALSRAQGPPPGPQRWTASKSRWRTPIASWRCSRATCTSRCSAEDTRAAARALGRGCPSAAPCLEWAWPAGRGFRGPAPSAGWRPAASTAAAGGSVRHGLAVKGRLRVATRLERVRRVRVSPTPHTTTLPPLTPSHACSGARA
jgi:hypothetical protein